MPLTAALLAVVQAATPAEPPDCAVYEGWFEFAREVRHQHGALTIVPAVSFEVYARMFAFDWGRSHQEFASLRQPDGEQIQVPKSVLNQIGSFLVRENVTCDWDSIGHGLVRTTEIIEQPHGDRLEDGSIAVSHAAISEDGSSALIFVSMRGGRLDEAILLERQTGSRWQVTARQTIHNP